MWYRSFHLAFLMLTSLRKASNGDVSPIIRCLGSSSTHMHVQSSHPSRFPACVVYMTLCIACSCAVGDVRLVSSQAHLDDWLYEMSQVLVSLLRRCTASQDRSREDICCWGQTSSPLRVGHDTDHSFSVSYAILQSAEAASSCYATFSKACLTHSCVLAAFPLCYTQTPCISTIPTQSDDSTCRSRTCPPRSCP